MSKNPFGEARQPLKKKIADMQLVIHPMKGRQATRAAYRFSKFVGPSFAAIAGDAFVSKTRGKNPMDMDIDFEKVIDRLFQNMNEHEFEELMDELLGTAELAGNRLDLDSIAFIGKPELPIRIAADIAQYQFMGFFSDWLPKIKQNIGNALASQGDPSPTQSQS